MNNEAGIARWNGPAGERWATFQETLDAQLAIYGADVLGKASLREGMHVLDIGCGCGATTLEAARAVGPGGRVVGLDISVPMLARAHKRARDLANVTLLEKDASTFVPDARFDVAISRFGVMFFADPIAAFRSLREAVKKGGHLAFVCWQALALNPWGGVTLSAVLRVMPPPPEAPPNAPGPFAFADAERLREILTSAGWRDIAISAVAHPIKLGDTLEEAVDYASRVGPAASLLRDADDETRDRAREVLRQTLAPFGPHFLLDGAAWLVTAANT